MEPDNSFASQDLKNQTVSGVSWSLLAQMIVQVISLIITAILARLLFPSDYGLIGMVMIFVGFARLVGKMGFGHALIQKIDISDLHRSSVFWLNLGIGVLLAISLSLAAPLIASFFSEPLLVSVTRAIAITFLIEPVGLVHRSMLQRALRFRTLSFVRIVSAIVSGILAIFMALQGYGVWALVGQMLCGSLIRVIGFWLAFSWRPAVVVDGQAIRSLLRYSLNLSGYSLIEYWSRNADNLLVGRLLNKDALGIYTRAYSLMLLPMSQIFVVVSQVMYPALAKIQLDLKRVRAVYLKAASMLVFVSFPMMFGLLVIAEPLIAVYLGPRWHEVVPILRILSMVGLIRSLTITGKWIYQSQGKVDIMFRWELIKSALMVLGMVLGIMLGGNLVRLAQAILVVSFLTLIPDMWLSTRCINLKLKTLFVELLPITLCSMFMALAVFLIDQQLLGDVADLPRLLIDMSVGALVYWVLVKLFRVNSYTYAGTLLREQWQMRTRRA